MAEPVPGRIFPPLPLSVISSSTSAKISDIEKIAAAYDLDVKVEIVY